MIVGWSCGAVAAMRYAQENTVHGLALVAPYYTDLGLDAVRRAGWVDQPWRWAQILANTKRVAIFHSDNDPYIRQSEFADVARCLDTEPCVVRGAGHFSEQDDFPELRAYITQTYGQRIA